MVKKLIKYDIQSYFRLLFPMHLVVIGIAIINRILQIFEFLPENIYYPVFISSCVLLGLSCMVCILMTMVISVVRFYQGIYSSEGYLNHTLPVTATQHLFAKLLTSVICIAAAYLTSFAAANIATLGDVNIELWKTAGYLIKESVATDGIHIFLIMFEALIAQFVYSCASVLFLYFCISIGQLANRKKLLLAFAVFFASTTIVQFIWMFMQVSVTMFYYQPYYDFIKWVTDHQLISIHICFGTMIVIYGIAGVIFLLVTRRIMSRRLNLS